MDFSQRTSKALQERVANNTRQLIGRFERILEIARTENSNRNSAAAKALQMEVETAGLIRAAEDLLSLTRSLKELWLFGKLQTIGTSEAEKRADEDAKAVEAGLRRLQEAGILSGMDFLTGAGQKQ